MIYDKFKAKERSSEVEVIQFHMYSDRSYRKCAEFVGKFWEGVFYVCSSYVFKQTYEEIKSM